MENILDWNELESDLTQKAGTTKMWWSIWSLVGILALAFGTMNLRFNSSLFDGTFGSGWTFDYNNYFQLMVGSVSSVIIMGLKVQAGLSKVLAKKKLLDAKDKQISELEKEIAKKQDAIQLKTAEIALLKQELDDKSKTFCANGAALDKLKSADASKKEVVLPCPQPTPAPPQPQSNPKQ